MDEEADQQTTLQFEDIFGEHLVKYKEPDPAEVAEANEERVGEDGEILSPRPPPAYYTKVSTAEFFARENPPQYVGVVFSAQYCPPCEKLIEPLKAFYTEFSKDGKFEMILVNCDKREKEYTEHLKSMDWCHALPYDVDDEFLEKLETAANADVIPKVAVFSTLRGFERAVCDDIKGAILLSTDAKEGVTQADKLILDGEMALNEEAEQQ